MKLSISNIAWQKEFDEEMYEYLSEIGFEAVEIAPTRIFEQNPYSHLEEAKVFSQNLFEKYGLKISSMQSIWFGKNEKIFGTDEERKELISYTKKAIDFAKNLDCHNIVFGCPKNRVISDKKTDYPIALEFFKEIGEYAYKNNTCIAIEPNPTIYNTNFINKTQEAIDIVKEINCLGVKINLDLGTVLQNEENIETIKNDVDLINHVHISEPHLVPIKKRDIHQNLMSILNQENYKGYVSIEMKTGSTIQEIKDILQYLTKLRKDCKNNGI